MAVDKFSQELTLTYISERNLLYRMHGHKPVLDMYDTDYSFIPCLILNEAEGYRFLKKSTGFICGRSVIKFTLGFFPGKDSAQSVHTHLLTRAFADLFRKHRTFGTFACLKEVAKSFDRLS